MWDEGSRRTYVIVRLADLATFRIEQAPFMQRSALHEKTYELPEGFVVVVRCEGRCDHTEIYTTTANITPLLPAPVELSDDEKIVLTACCSLKGGIRFEYANQYTGISRGRYDAAKASLIARKLLNKAGAVTVEGRNARPYRDLFEAQRGRGRVEYTPAP
jgi:hypothetical protein